MVRRTARHTGRAQRLLMALDGPQPRKDRACCHASRGTHRALQLFELGEDSSFQAGGILQRLNLAVALAHSLLELPHLHLQPPRSLVQLRIALCLPPPERPDLLLQRLVVRHELRIPRQELRIGAPPKAGVRALAHRRARLRGVSSSHGNVDHAVHQHLGGLGGHEDSIAAVASVGWHRLVPEQPCDPSALHPPVSSRRGPASFVGLAARGTAK